MKKTIQKITAIVLTLSFVVAVPVLAQSNSGSGAPSNSGSGTVKQFPKLENPLGGVNSITQLVNKLVDIAFQIGSVVAVIMIIYSGFKFVMARGNESELKEAKRIFFYTIVGIAVLFGARVLAEIIKATVDNIKNF